MPGPRPQDGYDPVQSVVPSTQAPQDYERVEASPQAFGSQIGAAEQGLGQATEKIGADAVDLATQRQGMLNESMATNAETDYITKLSSITDGYKTKQGLDAVAAKDETQQQIAALRQSVLGTLPTAGAQRAFNQLAQRHEAYALSDVGTYWSQQVKEADVASAQASTTTAANMAGSYAVASDDQRFKDSVQTINFGIARMMQNKGYGSAITSNGADGQLGFDESTPQGQSAKAVYDHMRDQALGVAWENRIHALADDPQNGSAIKAQQVFNANRDDIPPEAQMRLGAYLQPKVRQIGADNAANVALSQADAGYRQTVLANISSASPISGRPSPDAVFNAIHGNESSGKATSPTSVDGAVGPGQIIPATFKLYAKPGEDINNSADNLAVSRRMTDDYYQKYNGDPARIAVAYFSGPGNVAPAGSPTPWINDAKDGNGATTSGYVAGVESKLGMVHSKADYYKQNYATILDATRSAATAAHPDDPQAVDLAVARTEQQMSAQIRQQQLQYFADNDTVFQAMNGDLSKGTRPLTVDQLRATSPEVAQAWDRMQYQQPQTAREVANRILTENAKNNGGDDRTYGPAFFDMFNKVHSPDGTPGKVTDVSQLYPLVGQPGGITMAGLGKLREEINGRNTPNGEAESAMRAAFFKNAHDQISGKDETFGTKDPQGEEIYLKFLAHSYDAIDKLKAQGKTPQQIFSPDSSDYVGKSIAAYKRSPAQYQADLYGANNATSPPTPEQPIVPQAGDNFSTPEGIRSAYSSGRLTRDQAVRMLSGMPKPKPALQPAASE